MKLKSVELIGFKSFAKKTKINFPAGITEIVGPNGSGKSNIIEAIRWALGEQSAKNLRSSRMTDVIFSGSQSHPALNRAKVALVFDNQDHFINTKYTELRVARTVYRDGTNDYYLNGKPCRLRDIQDLFMNTGIGDGSFSIISQGRVAQIFKSKPVDRRFIIETVAGIYRYRAQKDLAAKKLSHVDENLKRVNDLDYELKQRLNNLAQDRHTALKYLKQKQLANHLDIERLFIRFKALNQQQKKHQRDNNQVRTSINGLKKRIDALNHKRQLFDKRLNTAVDKYNRMQSAILRQSQRLDALSNRNNLTQNKINFWRNQIKNTHADLKQNHQQRQKFYDNLSTLKKVSTKINHQISQTTEKLNHIHKKENNQKLNQHYQEITQLRNKYVNLIKLLTQIKSNLDHYQENHDQLRIQKNHLRAHLSKLKKLIARTHNLLIKVKSRLSSLNLTIKNGKIKDYNLESLDNQISVKLAKASRSYQNKKHRQQILQIRLNGLNQINARHSNLYYGVRNLLRSRQRFPGILGTVASFIKVPKAYIQAIETTLRSQLQQIIVDNSQTAKEIVGFMSTHHLGRVTLLPLNEVSKRWISPAVINHCQQISGFIGVASNLVKMPTKLSRIKLHLLGNVLVVRDISSAILISRTVKRCYRVVTLDGNIINAGGAITGGHGRYHYHGLLSQKAKREQYQVTVAKADRILKTENDQIRNTKKRLNIVKQNLQINQRFIGQKRQAVVIKSNLRGRLLDELHNYKNILVDRRKAVDLTSKDSNESVKSLRNHQLSVKRQLAAIKQRLISKQNDLARSKSDAQKIDQFNQKYRELLIRLNDQKKQNEHDLRNDKENLSRVNTQIKQNQNKVQQLSKLIRQSTEHLKGNQALERISKRIDQLTNQKRSYQISINRKRQSRSEFTFRFSKCQNHLITSQNQYNQNHLKQRDLERKLREVSEILLRKYQINVITTKIPDFKDSLNQVSSKLFDIQEQLRAIGPVNVNSIKRFKKVNHRYHFLSNQIKDLITSQRQLSTTMEQMNSKIRVRFKTTFDQVNHAFKLTYSQIFKGGRAKLKLIDPRHLLTTGINIMAQPPGKRYRSMELLSGGERALTAIALLFAILKVKPVPFCILDEAESALDAVNIDRFGEYMRKLKAKAQFIVITHRKTTMLYADNLYGVTMQNSGISKIISVNLRKARTEG